MLPFTFRQIEVFLAVCSAGNFRGAADRLHISQPAISNQIKALEAQLGVQLFQRRRGASCRLSADGESFKTSAEKFLVQGQALGAGAPQRARRRTPIRIYVGGHLLEDYVRPSLDRFHASHPELELNFLPQRTRAQLLQDIRRGLVDVALVTSAPGEQTPASLVLGTVEAGIYCRPDRFACTTRDDVARLPFILPLEGTPETLMTLELLRTLGIPSPKVVGSTQYHDVMVRMACEAHGAIFTIASIIERHDREGSLRCVLASGPWERRVHVDASVDAPVANALIGFLTEALATSGRTAPPQAQKSMPMPTV